jgi:hypothetical protein
LAVPVLVEALGLGHDHLSAAGVLAGEDVRGYDRCPGATGAILAFLGPNGAGKTTTIEILSWVTIACSHRPLLVRGSPVRLS